MRIGFSRQEMKFETGLAMAGYSERRGESTGKLAPLEIASICFDDNDHAVFFTVLDILGIPSDLVLDSGIPIATHTHSGPKPSIVIRTLQSIGEANNRLARADLDELIRIDILSFSSLGVCSVRIEENSDEPIEGRFYVFSSAIGKVGLAVFPCHPTVLGPDNTSYSSDLAGGIRRKLEAFFGFPVVYMNGCCGDISTRFTRKKRDNLEIERLSELFVSSIEVKASNVLEPGKLRIRKTLLPMTLKNGSEDREIPTDKYAVAGYELSKGRSASDLEAYREAPMAFVSMGKIAFLFLPFEVFYSTGRTLRKIMMSKFEQADVVCYSLRYLSYLTPATAHGTYENFASPYSEEAHDLLVGQVKDLMNEEGADT